MVLGNPVLKALDNAKTSTYHFKAIVIAGMGFFTDAYDLFVIGILTRLLGRIYYYDPTGGALGVQAKGGPGQLPINVNAAVIGTALCGTFAGQLFFGWLGDKMGRKRVYGYTLLLMIVASLGQGLSINTSPNAVISTLCFFRFWLGFGIGGDYPLSATIMSEYSNTKTRGAFVAAVFAMQGVGYLFGAAVTLLISGIFKGDFYRHPFNSVHYTQASSPELANYALGDPSLPRQADWVWRIVLMCGALPAALTFYSRSKMPETARYTALIEKNQKRARMDMESVLNQNLDSPEGQEMEPTKPQKRAAEFGLFSRQFAKRHGLELFGTCATWFLLDVSFYSQSLFQGTLFQAVGWVPSAKTLSGLQETFDLALAQLIITSVSAVPGYWFTVAFVDKVGRKPIAIMGFFMMSAFMYVLAFDFYGLRGIWTPATAKADPRHPFRHGNHLAFIILYSFTFFFSNFGPNATTFIVPAELFPARLRSTCHGISSASGKAGAIVGTFGFLYASADSHASRITNNYPPGIGIKYALLLLAVTSTVGCIVTIFCVPETKGRSLEDLSGEDGDGTAGEEDNFLDRKVGPEV